MLIITIYDIDDDDDDDDDVVVVHLSMNEMC